MSKFISAVCNLWAYYVILSGFLLQRAVNIYGAASSAYGR